MYPVEILESSPSGSLGRSSAGLPEGISGKKYQKELQENPQTQILIKIF